MIQQVRTDAAALIRFRAAKSKGPVPMMPNIALPRRKLAYRRLSDEAFDFLPRIAASFDIRLETCTAGSRAAGKPLLLNCFDVPSQDLKTSAGTHAASSRRAILAEASMAHAASGIGPVLTLPASYAALAGVCHALVGAFG